MTTTRALLARHGDLAAARAALAEAEGIASRVGAGQGSDLGQAVARARRALEG